MLIIRATKKLQSRLEGAPRAADEESSTTVMGDWFANVLAWRRPVVLLTNRRTLTSALLPLAPAATLLARVPEAIAHVLRSHGVAEETVTAELGAMTEVRLAPTNDRRLLGVMNEFAFQAGWAHQQHGIVDLDQIALRLSSVLVSSPEGGYTTADDQLGHTFDLVRSVAGPPSAPGQPISATSSVYQLKVTLSGTKPPIWRRVLVDGESTLDDLHEVIQAAFGWWNYHLHLFEIGDARYGLPDPDWDFGEPVKDERRARLEQVLGVGTSFRYAYDFGDGWEHRVMVERSMPASPELVVPACLGGRRAGPPEDCGGVWGYAELLDVLADPTHPEHATRIEWVGGQFDPEAFDAAEFGDNLDLVRNGGFDA